MNALNTQITRLLTVSLLGAAALTLQGCADGPGSDTTVINTTSGTTSGASGGTTSGASGGASGGVTSGASGGATGGATGGASGGVTGGATGGTTSGNGSCTNAATCPVVTVKLDGNTNDSLPDATTAALSTWSSTNTDQTNGSRPCTPSGGLGTDNDPWTHSGPFAYSNIAQGAPTGLTEQPIQNGVYTFVLTCINSAGDGASAGTATLTVGNGSTNPSPINVTVTATPSLINLGGMSTISWTAADANGNPDSSIVCMHSSMPTDPTWNAAATTATGSVIVTPTSAVIYTYTLTCRNAAGGSGAGAAPLDVVDINNPQLVQCPAGQQFLAFRNSASGTGDVYTAGATIDPLCVGCTVNPNPPTNLVAAASTSSMPAVITHGVGVLIDAVSITLADTTSVQTPDPTLGGPVGFIISRPAASVLSVDLLNSLTVQTLATDGTVVESSANSQLLLLDVVGLNADPGLRAVVFNARLPFSQIQLTDSGIANVLSTTNVYEGGACLAPPAAATSTTTGTGG